MRDIELAKQLRFQPDEGESVGEMVSHRHHLVSQSLAWVWHLCAHFQGCLEVVSETAFGAPFHLQTMIVKIGQDQKLRNNT